MLLASDDRNTEFSGARNPDSALHVVFYTRTTPNPFLTEQTGSQKFQDETFIRILIPGRNDLTIDEPAREDHKKRFPHQWAVFMNTQSEAGQVTGTPVTEWPSISRSMAEDLKGKRFYTVEQIAECSDGQIQALGMDGNVLRQKARAFLKVAKDTALAQQQAAELERKQKEMEDLKASIPAMIADAVARAMANPAIAADMAPKKRGRKPKAESVQPE